jgi:hypothetical protein
VLTRRSLLVAALALVSVSLPLARDAAAWGKPKDLREQMTRAIDDALGKARVGKAERPKFHAALAEVLRTAEDALGATPGNLPETEELLRIFSADPIDMRAVEVVRTRRDSRQRKLADALVQGYLDVHALLDPQQRGRLADHALKVVRDKQVKGIRAKVVYSVINNAVEGFLEQLGATEPERKVARDVRDRVLGAMLAARTDRVQQIGQLADLFRRDTVDRAEVEKLRAAQEQKVRELMGVVERGFLDLHAALSPQRRLLLVQLFRERQQGKKRPPTATNNPMPM